MVLKLREMRCWRVAQVAQENFPIKSIYNAQYIFPVKTKKRKLRTSLKGECQFILRRQRTTNGACGDNWLKGKAARKLLARVGFRYCII